MFSPRRKEIKIHPLDQSKNIYIGLKLPFSKTKVFTFNITTQDQIKSNLLNLLLTNRGERPFNPEFGSDLYAYLFEPSIKVGDLKDLISDRIQMYIPGVNVLNIEIFSEMEHTVRIRINYQYNNWEDKVQIEFN